MTYLKSTWKYWIVFIPFLIITTLHYDFIQADSNMWRYGASSYLLLHLLIICPIGVGFLLFKVFKPWQPFLSVWRRYGIGGSAIVLLSTMVVVLGYRLLVKQLGLLQIYRPSYDSGMFGTLHKVAMHILYPLMVMLPFLGFYMAGFKRSVPGVTMLVVLLVFVIYLFFHAQVSPY